MHDISLFLLDIVQNAIAVKASAIDVVLKEIPERGVLFFQVADNGPGMTEEQVRQATNPFYTTRTTRHVGLGLPFLEAAAKQANGTFRLESARGVGTTVQATFDLNSIDLLPYGDLSSSVFAIAVHPDVVDFTFTMDIHGCHFELALKDVLEALAPLSLSDPITQALLQTYLSNQIPLFL